MSYTSHWHYNYENMDVTCVLVLSGLDVSFKAQESRMTRTSVPFNVASEHKHQRINARMTRIFLACKHPKHKRDPSHAK